MLCHAIQSSTTPHYNALLGTKLNFLSISAELSLVSILSLENTLTFKCWALSDIWATYKLVVALILSGPMGTLGGGIQFSGVRILLSCKLLSKLLFSPQIWQLALLTKKRFLIFFFKSLNVYH